MLKSLPLPIPKMFLYSYEYKKLKLDHLFPAKVLTALCARARLKPNQRPLKCLIQQGHQS